MQRPVVPDSKIRNVILGPVPGLEASKKFDSVRGEVALEETLSLAVVFEITSDSTDRGIDTSGERSLYNMLILSGFVYLMQSWRRYNWALLCSLKHPVLDLQVTTAPVTAPLPWRARGVPSISPQNSPWPLALATLVNVSPSTKV